MDDNLANTRSGNGLNVLKVMPESAIKFGSFEAAKRTLAHLEGHGEPNQINSFSKFLAGGTGGVISQLVSTQISLEYSTNPLLGWWSTRLIRSSFGEFYSIISALLYS